MSVESVLILGAMGVLGFVVGGQQCNNVEVPRDELWLAKSVAHINRVGLRGRGAAIEKSQRGFIYMMVSCEQFSSESKHAHND